MLTQISFFGITFSAGGIKPDSPNTGYFRSSYTQRHHTTPKFSGYDKLHAAILPHLSHHTPPLHVIVQKNETFDWTPSANMEFQKLTSLVKATENSLKYFSENLPITVQADVSSEDLGRAPLQQGQPIAFASKRVSDTEKCYANIE